MALCATVALIGCNYLDNNNFFGSLSKWLFYLSLLVGILCGTLNPTRFPLTEGLAGEVGYEGLCPEDEEKGET